MDGAKKEISENILERETEYLKIAERFLEILKEEYEKVTANDLKNICEKIQAVGMTQTRL